MSTLIGIGRGWNFAQIVIGGGCNINGTGWNSLEKRCLETAKMQGEQAFQYLKGKEIQSSYQQIESTSETSRRESPKNINININANLNKWGS